MKKKESTLINMIISLALVTGISGACLGLVYSFTEGPIAVAKQEKFESALKKVLPKFDRIEDVNVTLDDNVELTANKAFKNDKLVGIAVSTFTMQGFSGRIDLMVGFLPNGNLYKVSVLKHKETPGLGTKMDDLGFYTQFENKHPKEFNWLVKKDGGDVDAITAATITSRAYCDGLQTAFEAFEKIGNLPVAVSSFVEPPVLPPPVFAPPPPVFAPPVESGATTNEITKSQNKEGDSNE